MFLEVRYRDNLSRLPTSAIDGPETLVLQQGRIRWKKNSMTLQSRKRNLEVRRSKDIMDGRAGFRLESSWGHISVLEGGGHICELISHKAGGVNPFWKPTWKTIDPHSYKPRKHSKLYGPAPEGRLLAGLAGHSISFDFFGPPSPEEIAAGHTTHGEAPVERWRRKTIRKTSSPALVYEVNLPKAQMRLQRLLSVDRDYPVVYCEETAANLSTFDRPISWNHHVTFGPPFLAAGVTTFDMPATESKVCPAGFSAHMYLKPDAEFRWPNAPEKQGSMVNLRTCAEGTYGHYTAHLLDRDVKLGFIAVCNPRLKLLVLYLFKRDEYPWVGNWEESYSRIHVPWKGREFCRGFEFSTTPFPVPRRETITKGDLFGEPTYIWLPASSSAKRRFMILSLDVREGFEGVAGVEMKEGILRVHERSERSVIEVPTKTFL